MRLLSPRIMEGRPVAIIRVSNALSLHSAACFPQDCATTGDTARIEFGALGLREFPAYGLIKLRHGSHAAHLSAQGGHGCDATRKRGEHRYNERMEDFGISYFTG
jgi:hypothetical protein